MSDIDTEGFVVVVTHSSQPSDDTSVVIVYTGQTEMDDEMVEVTFGVDRETAADIDRSLMLQHTRQSQLSSQGDEDLAEVLPCVMVLVEPWQVLK